jgi:uncharacterized coiled-coil protein SlyX
MDRESAEILADAISEHAQAIEKIHEDLRELITCMCTVDGRGNTATHPTIIIKKEENK